jgi:UDP:flavonoid glycosyltransferase YjiC (YdhE family)
MRALISGVVERGFAAHVFTNVRFEDAVAEIGGQFVDLYGGRPLADADGTSRPLPCRFVSFAGHFGDSVAEQAAALQPSIVVADTFAVVGRVVATVLDIPYVNVCAGHNANPALVIPELLIDPRVEIGAECRRAVDILHNRYEMENASPFSYVDGLSPSLNIYCEPPQYLTEEERAVFEPVAFFGSLPSLHEIESRTRPGDTAFFAAGPETTHVYASCGTGVWMYYTPEALEALGAIAEALGGRQRCETHITLGNADISAEVTNGWGRANVAVSRYVNQWEMLQQSDIFITHHGLNSTHEAVFSQVPMISYPFFGDQPGLAAKCRELDLAIPLATSPRAPITPDEVTSAIDRVEAEGQRLRDGLRRARGWELDVIATRAAVVDRLLALG